MTEAPDPSAQTGTFAVKRGLADMLRGGVIMDVVTAEQAKIAEDAGAVAVMALERVPADIRRDGGVARMSDPALIEGIQDGRHDPGHGQGPDRPLRRGPGPRGAAASTTSTRARCSPRPTRRTTSTSGPFTVPFVCGATNLGEALRRISEGAAMIRSKGEAGTGNIVEAVRHLRVDPRRHPRSSPRPTAPSATRWAKELAAPDRAGPGGRRDRARCRSRCSAPAASPPPPTPRSSCSSAPRRCSSARASSRARTRPAWRGPSSRRRPTSTTPSSWPRSSRGLGEAMRGEELGALDRAARRPRLVTGRGAA